MKLVLAVLGPPTAFDDERGRANMLGGMGQLLGDVAAVDIEPPPTSAVL